MQALRLAAQRMDFFVHFGHLFLRFGHKFAELLLALYEILEIGDDGLQILAVAAPDLLRGVRVGRLRPIDNMCNLRLQLADARLDCHRVSRQLRV